MVDRIDQEINYRTRFNNGTIAQNIWNYIPDKIRDGVTDAFADCDGYFVYLDHEHGGWVAYDGADDCGTIHEYTIKDLNAAIKTIRKK